MEAINNRLIVIASNISGNIDLINDSESGYLFQSEDSEDLCKKLEYAYNNSSKNYDIVQKARKVLEQYDIKFVTKKYIDFYNTLVDL